MGTAMRGSALVLLSPCVRKKLPVAGYVGQHILSYKLNSPGSKKPR